MKSDATGFYGLLCFNKTIIIMLKNPKNKYSVYVLTLNKNAVYVGCTSDIKERVKSHKSNKHFDNYLIIESFDTKKDALIAERCLIKYLSIFNNDNILNGTYKNIELYKNYL